MQTIDLLQLTISSGVLLGFLTLLIEYLKMRDAKRKETLEIRKTASIIIMDMIKLIYNCFKQVDFTKYAKNDLDLEKEIKRFNITKLEDCFGRYFEKHNEFLGLIMTYLDYFNRKDVEKMSGLENAMNNYRTLLSEYRMKEKIIPSDLVHLTLNLGTIKKEIEKLIPLTMKRIKVGRFFP